MLYQKVRAVYNSKGTQLPGPMECPVCMEVFRVPLLLPGCGHTLCASCAEQLLTDGNFLRCPECRLVYQLRKGVQSLPKNVALQRTIDEQTRTAKLSAMCTEHPDDAASLYCKTCEKSICLKCYFSGTLRRGNTSHSGHDVDTNQDAFSKERRHLEERCRDCEKRLHLESQHMDRLEAVDEKLKEILELKLSEIEKEKTDAISLVKQTSNKLKFTLKGSVARDQEFLQMALESGRTRVQLLAEGVEDAMDVLRKATNDNVEVNELKEARQKLDHLPDSSDADRGDTDGFLKVAQFDTSLKACLDDPRKALSYQTELPRTPTLSENDCIVSDTAAYVEVNYNEQVRVKSMQVYYKEAMFKGMCEKEWNMEIVSDISGGHGRLKLTGLTKGTMYKLYAVASNECGDSEASNELWFRTVDAEVEKRTT